MDLNELIKLLFGETFYATAIAIVLLVMSFGVWGVLLSKWWASTGILRQDREFLTAFKKLKEFHDLAKTVRQYPQGALTLIASAALEENAKLPPFVSHDNLEHRAGLVEEALQRSIESWRASDERHLSLLAISANLAPFLGLLGTVWGIMDAFFAIGKQGSAELAVVAPGIASALVTTVAGLLVAIPASGAYNYFMSRNTKRETAYYNFGSEILALFRRTDLSLVENASRERT